MPSRRDVKASCGGFAGHSATKGMCHNMGHSQSIRKVFQAIKGPVS